MWTLTDEMGRQEMEFHDPYNWWRGTCKFEKQKVWKCRLKLYLAHIFYLKREPICKEPGYKTSCQTPCSLDWELISCLLRGAAHPVSDIKQCGWSHTLWSGRGKKGNPKQNCSESRMELNIYYFVLFTSTEDAKDRLHQPKVCLYLRSFLNKSKHWEKML